MEAQTRDRDFPVPGISQAAGLGSVRGAAGGRAWGAAGEGAVLSAQGGGRGARDDGTNQTVRERQDLAIGWVQGRGRILQTVSSLILLR